MSHKGKERYIKEINSIIWSLNAGVYCLHRELEVVHPLTKYVANF